jgi:hypothetical protein
LLTDAALNAGTYFGSGNANNHWTVNQTSEVEVGLKALVRYIGGITPSGTTYIAQVGGTSQPGKTGSSWGYAFSVYLTDSNLTLSDISTSLCVQDGRSGDNACFDPSQIPDNSHPSAGSGFQNSETLSFGIPPLSPAFDMNLPDIYSFTLTVTCTNEAACNLGELASVSMTVDAVPEPASLALLGSGVLAAGFFKRRRRSAG